MLAALGAEEVEMKVEVEVEVEEPDRRVESIQETDLPHLQ